MDEKWNKSENSMKLIILQLWEAGKYNPKNDAGSVREPSITRSTPANENLSWGFMKK